MELTQEQKATVAQWFAAGASLDEIQKRVKAEFGIHMTYLDVRLMVAELPQPEEPAGAGPEETAGEAGESVETGESDPPGESGEAGEPVEPENPGEPGEEQAVSGPEVTIDALMLPGTLASGDVTFSDGTKGKWFLDQMGRLGLGGDLPQGYRPSPTDSALFQQQLMSLLHSKGLC